jgi:ABC-2 type transport system permease protein
MSSEKQNNTINTIIIKPLYRDTIINGKLLGASIFILLIIGFSTIVYIGGLFIVLSEAMGPYLAPFLSDLPLIIIFSLIYCMVFFSISVLVSILIYEDSFALFTSILAWFFFLDVFPNVIFAGNISLIIYGGFSNEMQQASNIIALFSPSSIRSKIFWESSELLTGLLTNLFEVGKLAFYIFILNLMSYISFLRKDIA